MADKKENILGTQPIGRLMLKFAIPSVVSLLLNAIYNIADQIFIGRSDAGTLGNGATAVAFPIISITMAISLLFGNGGAVLASLRMGEKNTEDVKRALANSVLSTVVFSVIITIVGFVFLEPIMKAFGATEELLPYAKIYSVIILAGVPFMAIGNGLSNFIRADGKPKIAMFSLASGAILNLILDPIFIFGFKMGVVGAALSTSLAQVVPTVVAIWYFGRKSENMRLEIKSFKPNFKIIAEIIKMGLSSSAAQVVITIVTIVLNNSLKKYAALSDGFVNVSVAVAAMGIVTRVNGMMIAVVTGIATGAQPILGYNKGAGNISRVKKTYIISVVSATVAAIICWAGMMFFTNPIVSVFRGEDLQFVSFASLAMKIYLMCVFTAGYQIVSYNYFQATGQLLKAVLLTLSRQIFLLVPAILILPKFFGIKGILYAGPFADVTAVLIVTVFIIKEMRSINGVQD